jgi:hypothetical protein
LREPPSKARAISPEVCPPDLACRHLARARWTGSAHGGDRQRADSGLGEFHVDVAAVAGGRLVLAAVSSVTVTLIVSRPVNSRLT